MVPAVSDGDSGLVPMVVPAVAEGGSGEHQLIVSASGGSGDQSIAPTVVPATGQASTSSSDSGTGLSLLWVSPLGPPDRV